jgi:hypothetical protein
VPIEASTAGRSRPRIPAFDHLRGYFLALIIVTHLYLMPNLVEVVTGRGALPASAAEGFCAISGIITGYVFLPRVHRMGMGPVAVRLLRRAGLVYLGAVALVLVRLMFTARNGEPVGIDTVVDALLLRQAGSVPPDFLAMYAVLVLVSPLVLWAARYRREWIPITIAAGTWIAAQFLPGLDDAWLMRLSWSFIFVAGIAIGCRWPELGALVRRVPRRTRRTVGVALVVVFVVTALAAEFLIFWNHHLLGAAGDASPSAAIEALQSIERRFLAEWAWFGPLQEKASLGPTRLVIGTLWFAALFLIFRAIGPALDRALGGLLSTFGRNSLATYVTHRLVIELVIAPTVWVWIAERDDVLLNTAAVVATEVVVLVCVRAWIAVRGAWSRRASTSGARNEELRNTTVVA